MVRLKPRGLALLSLLACILLLGCPEVDLKKKIIEAVVPKKPTTLVAIAQPDDALSSIRLNWSNNATDASSIIVERSQTSASAGFAQVTSLGVTVSTFQDMDLAQDTTYWYRVAAVNAVGPSYSNVATDRTYPLVTDAAAVTADFDALAIGYTLPDTGASSVTQNITLPTLGGLGSTISWTSNNAAIDVAQTGTTGIGRVTGQASADISVTLTATISRGTSNLTKYFYPVVKQTDAGSVAADKADLAIGLTGGDTALSNVTQSVTLPTAGAQGTTISWTSNDLSAVGVTGTVTRPSTVGDKNVTLIATIRKGSAIDQKQFTLTVKITDQGAVNVDAAALAALASPFTFIGTDGLLSVTQNFGLPLPGANGTTIEWVSSLPSIIDVSSQVTGSVTRPEGLVDGGQTVTLTATIKKGVATSAAQPHWDIVVKNSPVLAVDKVALDKAALEISFAGGDSASGVTQSLNLPSTGPNGSSITWTSNNTPVISNAGLVTRQLTDQTVQMTALIEYVPANDTKIFDLAVLQSDAGAVAVDLAALTIGYYGGDSSSSVTDTLTLATTGIKGTEITWISDTTGVINTTTTPGSGLVTRSDAGDTSVLLTASATKGSEEGGRDFPVIVKQSVLGMTEDVTAANSALAISYNSPDSGAASVTVDVILPLTGSNGTTVTWETSNGSVISSAGTVVRAYGGNVDVSLTATITKGTTSDTKVFVLTVLQSLAGSTADVAAAKSALAIGYNSPDANASSVTTNVTLPVSGSGSTKITWNSDNIGVISAGGVVARPSSDNLVVRLTATIAKNTTIDTKDFFLTVRQSIAGATADVAAAKSALAINYSSPDTGASNVTKDVILPTIGLNGTTVSWASNDAAIDVGSSPGTGQVNRQATGNVVVRLTATITKNSWGDTTTFDLTVIQAEAGAAADVAAAKAVLSIGYTSPDVDASSVTKPVTLPTSGSNGTTIIWGSDKSGVIGTDGLVTRQASGNEVVRLTATISKLTASDFKYFDLTVLQSDAGAVANDKSVLAIGYGSGDSISSVTQGLTLPTSGAKGTNISWESNNIGVISTGGAVTRQASGDAVVRLTATITKNLAVDTKIFDLTVLQTDAGAVANDKSVLAIGYGSGDSISSVTQGLTLPISGAKGTTISWESNNIGVISTGGAVTRQASGDAVVRLTATITKNLAVDTKIFDLTVLQTDAGVVADDMAALAIEYGGGDSNTSVTQNLTLPTLGAKGSIISWLSTNTGAISIGGLVTRPTPGSSNATVTLTATITRNENYNNKQFTLTVKAQPRAKLFYLDGGSWTSFALPPATTASIARLGTALYGLTSAGALYSYDAGWHLLSTPALATLQSISSFGGALYALANDRTLHYLDGASWKLASPLAPSGAVAIAGTAQTLYALTGSSIYYLDGGTWTNMGAPANPMSIAIQDGILYALTSAGDIHYYDGGWGSKLSKQAPTGYTELGGGSTLLYALSYQ